MHHCSWIIDIMYVCDQMTMTNLLPWSDLHSQMAAAESDEGRCECLCRFLHKRTPVPTAGTTPTFVHGPYPDPDPLVVDILASLDSVEEDDHRLTLLIHWLSYWDRRERSRRKRWQAGPDLLKPLCMTFVSDAMRVLVIRRLSNENRVRTRAFTKRHLMDLAMDLPDHREMVLPIMNALIPLAHGSGRVWTGPQREVFGAMLALSPAVSSAAPPHLASLGNGIAAWLRALPRPPRLLGDTKQPRSLLPPPPLPIPPSKRTTDTPRDLFCMHVQDRRTTKRWRVDISYVGDRYHNHIHPRDNMGVGWISFSDGTHLSVPCLCHDDLTRVWDGESVFAGVREPTTCYHGIRLQGARSLFPLAATVTTDAQFPLAFLWECRFATGSGVVLVCGSITEVLMVDEPH
jgi:hypothetical protein